LTAAPTPGGLPRACIGASARPDLTGFYEIYNDIFTPIPGDRRPGRSAPYIRPCFPTDPERFGFVMRRFPEILFFDGYVLSYELRLLKPDPAIYRAAARLAGSEPAECVFIDDMEENVKGAAAAGLAGIRYAPETDLAAELRKLGLRF
jgi:hypothetical protein